MIIPLNLVRLKKAKRDKQNEMIALGDIENLPDDEEVAEGPIKSQIVIKSDQKAMPEKPKATRIIDLSNNSNKFVASGLSLNSDEEDLDMSNDELIEENGDDDNI